MPREIIYNTDEVLEIAVHLFWEKGYAATSMQDLTEATGLNRSSIYNSFGSKLELYKLALKTYQKEAGTFFQKALMKSNNSLEAIEQIFASLITEVVSGKGRKGCFTMNCKAEMSQKDDGVLSWLEQTQEQNLTFFEALVSEGQKEGLINRKQTPFSYANYLYSAFQGMRMTGILINDKRILSEIADTTLQVLH